MPYKKFNISHDKLKNAATEFCNGNEDELYDILLQAYEVGKALHNHSQRSARTPSKKFKLNPDTKATIKNFLDVKLSTDSTDTISMQDLHQEYISYCECISTECCGRDNFHYYVKPLIKEGGYMWKYVYNDIVPLTQEQ